jgi:uncharacterized protein (TIGR02246 family)
MGPADRQAIYDLIADYCYTFDAADHDAFAELFTANAVFGRSGSEVQGKEAIRELSRKRWLEESTPRRHMVSNIRLSEPGPDGAIHGKAMFIVTIATTGESRARILATGWYDDIYVNTPGGWKFANRINYVDPRGKA